MIDDQRELVNNVYYMIDAQWEHMNKGKYYDWCSKRRCEQGKY